MRMLFKLVITLAPLCMAPSLWAEPCSPGSSSGDGQMPCTLCPPGKYQPSSGTTSCIDCAIGTAQPLSGQVQCNACQPGTSTPVMGSAACTPCSAGSSQPLEGQPSCPACALGYAQPLQGQTSCLECPAGTYTDITGATECIDCPPRQTTNDAGSTEAEACFGQDLDDDDSGHDDDGFYDDDPWWGGYGPGPFHGPFPPFGPAAGVAAPPVAADAIDTPIVSPNNNKSAPVSSKQDIAVSAHEKGQAIHVDITDAQEQLKADRAQRASASKRSFGCSNVDSPWFSWIFILLMLKMHLRRRS